MPALIPAYFTWMPKLSRLLLWLALLASTPLAAQQRARYTTPYGANAQVGKYANVNGIKLYYEVYGTGKPLVLLHGSGGSIRAQAAQIEHFRGKYQVIAVDSRAHGKSTDNTSVLTYELMASDIAKLLDELKLDSCSVFGQSDGGILGLLLARDYPRKVKRVATFGANLQPDSTAVQPAIWTFVQDTVHTTKNAKLKQIYTLVAEQPHILPQSLAAARAPVLLMYGDRDIIRLEHALQIFTHLPNSNLFVMPGATHFGMGEKPELFWLVLSDFLEKPFIKLSTAEVMGIDKRSKSR